MKEICSKCKISADMIKITSNGYCVNCQRQYASKWRAVNKEKIRISNAKFNKENPVKRKAYSDAWIIKNKEYRSKKRRDRYLKNKESEINYAKDWQSKVGREYLNQVSRLYRAKNYSKVLAWNRNRACAIKNAIPKWSTVEDLKKIILLYEKAKWLESITGLKYDIDHVIPLKGVNVCGLHIWENLQILERSLNRKKHNKF